MAAEAGENGGVARAGLEARQQRVRQRPGQPGGFVLRHALADTPTRRHAAHPLPCSSSTRSSPAWPRQPSQPVPSRTPCQHPFPRLIATGVHGGLPRRRITELCRPPPVLPTPSPLRLRHLTTPHPPPLPHHTLRAPTPHRRWAAWRGQDPAGDGGLAVHVAWALPQLLASLPCSTANRPDNTVGRVPARCWPRTPRGPVARVRRGCWTGSWLCGAPLRTRW